MKKGISKFYPFQDVFKLIKMISDKVNSSISKGNCTVCFQICLPHSFLHFSPPAKYTDQTRNDDGPTLNRF